MAAPVRPRLPRLPRWFFLGMGVLSACALPRQIVRPMPGQGDAFALVRERFVTVLPAAVLVEPEVLWSTKLCPGKTETAVVIGTTCYAGLGYRDGAIDVAWRGSFGKSAYAHELMHFFLKKAGRDSDPAHNQTALWDLVNATDLAMQERSL